MPLTADALQTPPPLSAPVEAWLVEGGDDRIALDPETGLNRYGCGLRPDDSLTAFGSSTASTVSSPALQAAEARLALFEGYGSLEAAWIAGSGDLKARLGSLCGLRPDERIVLAASGTDALRVAADHVRRQASTEVVVVLPEPRETGRGAPAALCPGGGWITVRLREADGRPRTAGAIDAEVDAHAGAAIARGAHVLLCVLDVSKTGLIAPSPDCARRLAARWPDRVNVLIDACQFRLEGATLRAYLDAGFLVAVTGSKFLAGPAFSGALILPSGLRGSDALPEPPSLGVLLRWEAAVAELAVFQQHEPSAIGALVRRFGEAVNAAIDASPSLERLETPPPVRPTIGAWDQAATIFGFLPARERRPLSATATQALFTNLVGARLGQPVPVGARDGVEVSALRLALSARQITAALSRPRGETALIDRALAVLERTARQAAA